MRWQKNLNRKPLKRVKIFYKLFLMKSRNEIIGYIYLRLRNIALRSLLLFTKAYSSEELAGIDIRNILVIKLDRIGDMVMTTPIFRALKERCPNAQISVLVNPVNKSAITNNPFINSIFVYDKEKKHKSLNSRIHFLRSIREKKFDLVIDPYLDYELNTSFITRFVGSKFRLGFEFAGREIFYNIRYPARAFPVFTEKKQIVDYYFDLISSLGVKADSKQPEIFLTSGEKENACQLLKNKGLKPEDKAIGIHPGAHHESQRWPVEKFAAVSDYLITRYGANVILFAGHEEKHLLSEFLNYADEPPIVSEGIDLRQFMSVLSYCNLFLCNNSGPLHIATALNIPTVSTMGPTIPFLWWPRGENQIVLRKDVDCSPCKRGVCGTHDCMELITTEDFIDAVERQISTLNIFPSSDNSFINTKR